MESLERAGKAIIAHLEVKNAQREVVLALSRRLVQHSARAIRAVHREEWDQALSIMQEAESVTAEMLERASGHPDILSAGYTLDAQKEFAEAKLTYALVRGLDLPSPDELGVDGAAWLNGLGEAAAELRRASLDRIRVGESAQAEVFLDRMQEIHTFLTTIDFPAAITRNLKRTNDMVRGVTERTRGDLTITARQESLEKALRDFESQRLS